VKSRLPGEESGVGVSRGQSADICAHTRRLGGLVRCSETASDVLRVSLGLARSYRALGRHSHPGDACLRHIHASSSLFVSIDVG